MARDAARHRCDVKPRVLIRPAFGWVPSLRELAEYRELVLFLAWRDVSLRYRQAALGIAWVVFQPLASMGLFSVVFGRMGGMPSDGVPYPVFAYVGLVVWQLFSSAMVACSNSLVQSPNLVSKVYFPRLVIPIAAVLPPLVDTAAAVALVPLLLAVYGIAPSARALAFPLFVALALLAALAVGLWFAALNVRYRDVRHVVALLIQFWMFASPVVYPTSLVPPRFRLLLGLNPMAGPIEGARWSLLGAGADPWPLVAVSTLLTFAILAGGLLFFRLQERTFADEV